MFWILATYAIGLHPFPMNEMKISAPGEIGCVISSPTAPAFTVLDVDADDPVREYCFKDSSEEDEKEKEDGEGEGRELFPAEVRAIRLERPCPLPIGFALSNGWVLGLGPDARVPYLRC